MIETNETTESPRMLLYPGIGQVTSREVVIASVHFSPFHAELWHNGKEIYHLPAPDAPFLSAVTPENVGYLTVRDTQQFITVAMNPDEAPRSQPAPVPVEAVVNNLMTTWTANRLGPAATFLPGVMPISGRKVTQDEFKRMVDMELAHCNAAVEEADQIWITKKGTIQDRHRKALAWLGSAKRDWFKPIEPGQTKRSVITGREIPMEALADDNQRLIDYYIQYNLDPMEYGDVFCRDYMKKNPQVVAAARRRLGAEEPSPPPPGAKARL